MSRQTSIVGGLGIALALAACAPQRSASYSESFDRSADAASRTNGKIAGIDDGLTNDGVPSTPMANNFDEALAGSLGDNTSAIDGSEYDIDHLGSAARAAEVAEAPTLAHMIQHHQEGAALARLGEQKGQDLEVKRVAAQLRGTAEKALAMKHMKMSMKEASASAPSPAPSSAPSPTTSRPVASATSTTIIKLQGLSGADFDRQWVTAAIAHHRAGQQMAAEKMAAHREGDDHSAHHGDGKGDAQKPAPSQQMKAHMQAMQQEQQQELTTLQALQQRLGT